MSTPPVGERPAIVGRDAELASVARFVAGGSPARALVVAGEAGIGKTTLWEHGVSAARGLGARVLAATASEAELQLPFVALADLLERIDLAEVPGLPAPQRRAVESALLRAAPRRRPSEPLAIAAGVTHVLRVLAADQPVLVAVDDIPWLDPSSGEVLGYAARRVSGLPVRFLLARRSGGSSSLEAAFPPLDLERVEVGPLSLGAVRTMLVERLGLLLPRRVLRRVVESAAGNPLYALELGRLVVERGIPAIGAELPVPGTAGTVFDDRIAGLAAPVRRALLVVALAGAPHRVELAGLLDDLALDDAIASELLVVDGDRLRPSHPLLAAAVRAGADAPTRREVHLAIAASAGLDDRVRTLHRALAASSPDAELARGLAAAASEAISRGAAHEAVQIAEHAVRLSPGGSDEQHGHLLALARYLVIAGEVAGARDLLEARVESFPAGPPRARAYLVLGECASRLGEKERLLELALAEAGDDPELRATVLATQAAVLAADRFRDLAGAERLALAALDAARSAGAEAERWAATALGWIRLLRGRPVDDLVARFPSPPEGSSLYETALERVWATRLVARGEAEAARTAFGSLLALAEERGEARSALIMHLGLCEIELRAGDALALHRLVEELDEWSAFESVEEIEARCEAFLALLRGDADAANRWAGETVERARAVDDFREEVEGRRAQGVAALFAGDAEAAVAALDPIWAHMCREGIDEPGTWPMAPDLVEALVQLRRLDRAREVTDRLERLAVEQEHPWALAGAARCRALLALAGDTYDEGAAALLEGAAARYAAAGLRFDEARSWLGLGRSQRRFRKWSAARRSLERAAEAFEALGAGGWADLARAESGRIGARRPPAAGTLTATEERVARLAAEGLSNKRIAAELVVSVHTVEKHLTHVYSKLGVGSRAQLARRLA